MPTFESRAAMMQYVSEQRAAGKVIGFVPTMGNLHQGHLSLMSRARELADIVIVSIYVNPMQFDQEADLQTYPRTLQEDLEKLVSMQVDGVFLPDDKVLYPDGLARSTKVSVPVISEVLCGAHRPGHFDGVSTVVAKLFGIVKPDVAVFGEKDFQQLMIIRHMVEDLCLPVRIEGAAIVREDNGLAMSSRNSRLTQTERDQASLIHQTLSNTAQAIIDGDRAYGVLEAEARALLNGAGFVTDYFTVRERRNLDLPSDNTSVEDLVILVAVHMGNARLIDNVAIGRDF
ncbi:MAG: pantoate--beta-alanine ligase [Gammaproteobacteria bacterium]|nr:pantoate--beta-alanine ligase [Gammaproteobacteria bacterium]